MSDQLSKKELYDQKKQKKFAAREQRIKSKKTKSTLLWVIVVVVIIGAVFGLVKLANKNNGNSDLVIPPVSSQDHVKGNPTAPIILTEYSDFQCPACASYESILEEIAVANLGKLAIIYRHFPLKSIHPNAEPAARASEAAALQGAFWEMHNTLFQLQAEWSASANPLKQFLLYATDLNLDVEKFEADYKSSTVKEKVDSDYRSAIGLGLNSTPTFFINGVKIPGFRNAQELQTIIDSVYNLIQAEKNVNAIEDADSTTTPNSS